MNTEMLILSHLMAFPGQTPAQIARAIGRTRSTVVSALPVMTAVGDVWSDAEAHYFTAEPAGEGDEKYIALCGKAYSLQERNLWNRAANVWQQAQQSTRKARIRANMCVAKAKERDPKPLPDPFCVRGKRR
ncbi:helix-turn-helix domain-containing protein [uncultured Pantoea sp.]|uniref:MarR family transcriptional regulator n=1 Tax=uncultured Pantoea sp. TaxID=218084 RepID=UPI0025EB95A7|nr:helix-turn-helix domain-containing protein [uncultured Pantoea sp.]